MFVQPGSNLLGFYLEPATAEQLVRVCLSEGDISFLQLGRSRGSERVSTGKCHLTGF